LLPTPEEITVTSAPTAVTSLFTPAEVAALLYVDPKTVSRWAMAGKIQAIRTPGGHRRFLRSEILALVAADIDARQTPPSTPTGPPAVAVQAEGARPARIRPDVAAEVDRRAAAVLVAEAVRHALRAQAAQAAADVISTAAAVDAAADHAAEAARRSREERGQAADEAAKAIASHAARTAADIQRHSDISARRLNQAALDAAAVVLATRPAGRDRESAAAALQLAAQVKTAAVLAAADCAEAAARVASAVAAAAAAVAYQVSALDQAIESEVARVAAAVQAAATTQARRVAAATDARASATAMLATEAARAVRYA
jgi:excisionase family DNA binding protein